MKDIRKIVGMGYGAAAAGLALSLWASSGFAGETADDSVFMFPKVDNFKESFARLRAAHDDVYNNATIQRIFQDNKLHALSIAQRVTDAEIETTKFQHYFKGLEVIGSKVFHHAGQGSVEVDSNVTEFDLNVEPSLSQEDAVSLARSAFSADQGLDGLPVLKILPAQDDQSARLIFWVGFEGKDFESGRDILVDAQTGDLLADISRNIEIAPVNVLTTRLNGKDVPGCQTLDSSGRPDDLNVAACKKVVSNGKVSTSADTSARQAAANSKAVLTYYQSRHGRNSYDDRGSPSVSVVHIGKSFDNAFWSSDMKIMAYGDGDGVDFGDFTKAVDVAGHEMTHGVTSETAKLMYMDESGALNEAFSDFFGKMIANDGDWAIGKKIFLKGGKGIRDLANPGALSVCAGRDAMGNCTKKLPYPASMKEKFPKQSSCGPQNDNCWVHVNSTVPGHAMYLVSQSITKQKAERLFYLVLTHYMAESSSFKDFGAKSVEACKQLFDATTCSKVKASMTDVGLI